MATEKRSTEKIVDEQIKRWEAMQPKEESPDKTVKVVTVSREPGSSGGIVAERLGEKLNFDLLHKDFVSKMAENSKIAARLFETVDEKYLSVLEDWIAFRINEHHLWPDQYLKHIMKIVGTMGKHGNIIIVGRGANFILPPEKRFRIRIIAPMHIRVETLCNNFGVSKDEAKKRINRTSSDRKAFVRKHFNADITNPTNYDLLINMEFMSIGAAVATAYNGIKNFELSG